MSRVSSSAMGRGPAPKGETARWHDVECAGYTADLPLWRELAEQGGGPVLEIGAGTGRVSLDLACRGHGVTALDCDAELLRELSRRARAEGIRLPAETGDARAFELRRRFSLVIAPMQVVQLLGGVEGRRGLLRSVRRHLADRGVVALAVADPLEGLSPADASPPLPDVREFDGWVYSSRPVAMREEPGAIAVERVREAVSPDGHLHESMATIVLDRVDPGELYAIGMQAGLHKLPPRSIPSTGSYVGSTVVVMEAA